MSTTISLNADRAGWLPNPYLVSVALLLAFVLPKAAGYVGGGGDDYHYVQMGRCIAAHGWCEPGTHWAARWSLTAPMGAAFALLGDGRWQATVVPYAYAIIAALLFVHLVNRTSGRAAALIAGVAFVSTATFAQEMSHPSADTAELAWLIAAVLAGHYAVTEKKQAAFAVLAGICFGLAIQARMTSIVWLPILVVGLVLIPGSYRRLVFPALIGFALPISFDMLMNWHLAGDPFLTQHLSVAHTRIPTTELPASLDLSKSPMFNPDFIGNWTPSSGIHLHWTVQGVVNLIVNPLIGPTLLGGLAMLYLRRRHLGWRSPEVLMTGAAVLCAGALIYALAIDPKPRMFMPVVAIAAALIGRLGAALWRDGERGVVGAVLIGLVVISAVDTSRRVDMTRPIPVISQWAKDHPGDIAVDETTRRYMTFDAEISALPVWPARKSYVLSLIPAECRYSTIRPFASALVRSASFGGKNDPLYLCEFRIADPARLPRP